MLSRRQFLKISAAVATAGAAGASLLKNLSGGIEAKAHFHEEPDRIVPTFCEICFWKCGMMAHVKNEKVVQITGNPHHPISNGKLCPRGMSAPGIVNDPDRLKKPLIRRTKESGEQYFEEVSWDEALDYTSKKLQSIMDEQGPDKIALFKHGHGGGLFKDLLKAMGGATVVAPSYAQCRGPRDMGFILTFGSGVGNPELIDVPNTRAIALIGSHLGENMHNTAVQDISHAIGEGASIITVDPRFSTIAGKSDYWLPIKPGTDIALLLAWANVLIEEELYNKEFITNNATGFEELKQHVQNKTPEWAYIATGIEPDTIRKTARILGANAPHSLVHPGRHVVWYGDDTQRSRAIAIVNALLGNWGKVGGFHFASRFPISSPEGEHPPKPKSFSFPPAMVYPLQTEVPAQEVVKASIKGQEGITEENRIRSWIVYGSNLIFTMPNPDEVRKAMEDLDFVLAIDILPAEVTGYADVVFPENTFLERYDDFDARSFRKPFVAIRQPAVESMYDSRPGWWMVKQLARRLKWNNENLEKYFQWPDMEERLKETAKLSGFSWEEVKEKGAITKESPSIYDNSPTMKFNTTSGKVELHSRFLETLGFDPIPEYVPQEDPPEGYFRLLFGRNPVHSFSRTTNNKISLEIFPENELWINEEMGRIMNLRSGVYVTLENQDEKRSGKIKVKLTSRIRQDCVYMVHGFGRSDKRLTKGYGHGAADSEMISRYKVDPIMGGTGMNVNFVKIERAI